MCELEAREELECNMAADIKLEHCSDADDLNPLALLPPLALLTLLLVRLVAELRAFSCFLPAALVLLSVLVPVVRLVLSGTPMPSAASDMNQLKRIAITACK